MSNRAVAVNEASVYEKRQLASALTNDAGYFKLKLKNSKTSTATLFISKEFYEDTSIVIEPRHNQEITITMMPVEKEEDKVTVAPEDYLLPDSIKAVADTVSKTTCTPGGFRKCGKNRNGKVFAFYQTKSPKP